jgi:hypothetical protein
MTIKLFGLFSFQHRLCAFISGGFYMLYSNNGVPIGLQGTILNFILACTVLVLSACTILDAIHQKSAKMDDFARSSEITGRKMGGRLENLLSGF